MNKKENYRTVFISDIHLGNPKNQSDKLIEFLDSISFKNIVIVGDFIDYRQINGFGKRGEKEQQTLNYINNLAKSGMNITYIQGNHDRELKCTEQIKLENMTICREMYYKTAKGKTYYIAHGDCIDSVNDKHNRIGEFWSKVYGLGIRIEHIRNKKVYEISCISIPEKIDKWVKGRRVPEDKINDKISKFSKNLNCNGIIMGHFHLPRHYEINGLDYFNTGDRLKHLAAVVEDKNGDLKLIHYEK